MEFIIKNLGRIFSGVTIAVILFFVIKFWENIKKFVIEVKGELAKVSWSTRAEVKGATIVVISITFIMAVYIGVVDVVLSRLLSLVFR